MNNCVFISMIICLFLFLPLFSVITGDSSKLVLKVGLYEDEPLIFRDTNGNVKGLYADILGYIAAKEGWEIEYVYGTLNEGLVRIKDKEIDILTAVAYSPERATYTEFSNETVFPNWAQVYTRPSLEIESFLDLEYKRIAVVKGDIYYVGPNGIKNLMENFDLNCTFVEVNDYLEVIRLIEEERVDAGILTRLYESELQNNLKLAKSPLIYSPIKLLFGFPKASPQNQYLIEKIDYHLKILKDDHNSVYYSSINEYMPIYSVKEVQVFPKWLKTLIVAIFLVLIIFVTVSMILSREVKKRTNHLNQAIEDLQEEIAHRVSAENSLKESQKKYRELTDKLLLESKSKFESIYNNAAAGIDLLDKNFKFIDLNDRLAEMFGYNKSELIGKSILDFTFPEDIEITLKNLNSIVNGNIDIYSLEKRFKKKDGSIFWGDVSASAIMDENKNLQAIVGVIIDITSRKKAEELLEESEEKYRELVENANSILAKFDKEGRIISMNDFGLKLFGYEEHELKGKTWIETILPRIESNGKNLENLANEILNDPDKYSISINENIKKNGERIWVYWNNKPIYENGVLTGILSVGTDITERKKAEEELYKANKQLEEADRLKSIFLSSMSHELRTPLNSIIGFTGILLQGLAGDLNEEQKKQLGIIKKSSQHLLSLINDILDISKIEAGKLELDCENFDLKEVIEDVISTFDAIAKDKNLKIESIIPENVTIYNDKRRFKQIIINLVGNAIKYTNEGGVKIIGEVLDKNNIEIRIIDTGVGIKKEDLSRIFEPFQQLDEKLTKKVEGTGLGLHLVKKLLILMKGNISLESEYGKGSIFTIIMPLKERDE
ncbi:MAG: PAS domain S-box protein [Candidatus Methanofastidiosa archaeon]|nr:PAS domain S-box protein [Candidatus Methanofastidiosa archaeon]